ncbi:uncharacterized protein LOC143044236 [Mytilus galloprovincialis]|uniref:uncharacterized protein LOC143044236 n=1 Tax=Mytilus galloprovincialis TaxID=29158 RepID=UPI003F7CBC44
MQLNQEEIIMFRILIYGFTLVVLASTTTPNSEGGVEVRLLDNQNAPLMATLDMSKADERVKQFVSDAIEAKMKNIEQTMRSKQFVIETLDAKMKAIEGIMKSQIINFERNLTDQLTDYINKMVVKVDQENGKSSTYIRWGRSDCSGVNTEVVYSGYAAGEKYLWSSDYRGGASNMLCLPNNPELSDKAGSGNSYIFGTKFAGNQFATDSANKNVPCALCRSSSTSSSVMIPGRKSCYTGWKEGYNGILAATAYSLTPSPYICIDAHPTYVNGAGSDTGHLLYVTAIKCGSLPCPPYKDNVQVYCVVCSK